MTYGPTDMVTQRSSTEGHGAHAGAASDGTQGRRCLRGNGRATGMKTPDRFRLDPQRIWSRPKGA